MYTSSRVPRSLQDCLVLLNVPALKHAACGGVLVLI